MFKVIQVSLKIKKSKGFDNLELSLDHGGNEFS